MNELWIIVALAAILIVTAFACGSPLSFVLGVALLFSAYAVDLHLDNKRWAEFSRERNCRVIGHSNGRYASTGYQCDDGIQYWRKDWFSQSDSP